MERRNDSEFLRHESDSGHQRVHKRRKNERSEEYHHRTSSQDHTSSYRDVSSSSSSHALRSSNDHSRHTSSSTHSASPSHGDIYGQCQSVSLYHSYRQIGEGTYGTVYQATHSQTSQIVALKRIILHNEITEGFPITSIREIATLRSIQHQNCIQLLDIVVNSHRDGVFLVFEYCEHDLSSLLSAYPSAFTESESKSLVLQLLSAISYLHDHWIIHRDIKLSNILYNNKGEVKLADFGLARKYSYPMRPMTPKVVTLWYRAPEVLLGYSCYTPSIDVWAIGCVFAELMLNKPLFPGEDDLNQLDHIFSLLGAPTEIIWPLLRDCSLIKNRDVNLQFYQQKYRYNNLNRIFPQLSSEGFDFLSQLLTYDPLQRITARKAISHSYFDTSPYPKEPDLMPTFPTKHDSVTPLSSLDHSGTQLQQHAPVLSDSKLAPRYHHHSRSHTSTLAPTSSSHKKRMLGAAL